MSTHPEDEGRLAFQEAYQERNPTPERTALAVARVKAKLLEERAAQKGLEGASKRWWEGLGWGWPLATTAAMAMALLVLWPGPHKAPFVLSKQIDSKRLSSGAYKLSFPDTKGGQIKGKHWMLKASQGTALLLAQPSTREVKITLTQGTLHNDIIPNKMKTYQVQTRDLTIRVKGTVFDVIKTNDWTRVEVHRGKVEVAERGSKEAKMLQQRQGLRLDHRRNVLSRYPLPPRRLCQPSGVCSLQTHMKWLATHHPLAHLHYALDLGMNKKLPSRQRREWLEIALDWTKRQQQPTLTVMGISIAHMLFQLETQPGAQNNALIETLRSCSILLKVQARPAIASICLDTLRTLRKPPFRLQDTNDRRLSTRLHKHLQQTNPSKKP